MKRIDLLIIFTIAWIFIITNVEAMFAYTPLTFVSVQPIVFMLAVGVFVVTLSFPKTSQSQGNLVVVSLFGTYLLTQFFIVRAGMTVEAIILNIIFEVGVLTVSYMLCHELSNWFINYNSRLKEAVFSPVEHLVASTFSDIEQIEMKISRERRFERELSIVHVNLENVIANHKQQGLRYFAENTNKEMLSAQLAEMFQFIASVPTTKAWYNNNLVLCIPAELNSPQVSTTIKNLKAVMDNVLKVPADITMASFPQDGLVLSDLVENATNSQKYWNSDEQRPVVYSLPNFQSQRLSG